MVEGLPLRTVADRFGTPLYVYSKCSIIDQCRSFERVFDGLEHQTSYAVKANSNRALLRIIAGEGLGADVGSKGEMFLALDAGFSPDKIAFSGVGKRDDEIRYALERGVESFNVESEEEISVLGQIAVSMGKSADILLRVNLDIDAGGHAYVSTSLKRNKFGIDWQQAGGVLQWAKGVPGIRIRGIHSHLGSQIVDVETFLTAARRLADLVNDLRRTEIQVTDLDFGGGYGVQYRGFVAHPKLPPEEPQELSLPTASLVQAVLPILQGTGCRLLIQPGRSIVAYAGALLVKVIYRKVSDERVFIIVDGGMNDLIRPSLYNAYHQIVPLTITGAPHEKVDVVGPLCESGDFFAHGRMLPRSQRGDALAIMCAGAYGYVLSSNYNARLRPAEVLVDGTTMIIIRERETLGDL